VAAADCDACRTLRHNETFCTRTNQNGREQTQAPEVRTGARRSGPEQTGTHSPLSGPRYRGSNPCLPAALTASRDIKSSSTHNHVIGCGSASCKPTGRLVQPRPRIRYDSAGRGTWRESAPLPVRVPGCWVAPGSWVAPGTRCSVRGLLQRWKDEEAARLGTAVRHEVVTIGKWAWRVP